MPLFRKSKPECEVKTGERLVCEAASVEWIEAAADGEKSGPKKVSITAYTGGRCVLPLITRQS